MILCTMLGMSLSVWGQQDINHYFKVMPDSLCPLLTANNKADFADFLASNMPAKVRNKLGNTSEMTRLTPDYLHLRMSANSTWEMKLLPVKDTVSVICVVRTYTAPHADSDVTFYTTDWQVLPTQRYLPPQEVDGKYLRHATLSSENATLTWQYTVPEYVDDETRKRLTTAIEGKEKKVYQWKDGKFQ